MPAQPATIRATNPKHADSQAASSSRHGDEGLAQESGEGLTPFDVVVDRLDDDANGVTQDPAGPGPLRIAGALPGERAWVAVADRGALRLLSIVEPSPDRVEPPCRHAPQCGGCALQHMTPLAALGWKSSIVAGALQAAGYAGADVEAVTQTPWQALPRTRRRMDLAFARARGSAVRLGLHGPARHEIVDLMECHVLDPRLFALLAPLRRALEALDATGSAGAVVANLADDGADILLRTTRAPNPRDRARLASFAADHRIERISWQALDPRAREVPETTVQHSAPHLRFGPASVALPPAVFLQATQEGEAIIVGEIMEALAGLARRALVVELYAGIGTLTFPMAARHRVLAIDGDPHAGAALKRAIGTHRIESRQRDLARAPLQLAELKDVDAIVLDPPFGGAGAQADIIAAAGVPIVVLVSCNPAALRRQAGILQRAGYALERSRTIDQFLYSARIESVSVFTRKRPRQSR